MATCTMCAEGSLVLVSDGPDLGDKNQAALGTHGTCDHSSFYRAGVSPQSTALTLKIWAQYVLSSPRQPLQTLNSTREQASKGRPCTSTLTETLQLATYFKNGNEVAGGSSQAHARCLACPQSRSPRVNGAPILVRGACRTRRRSQP